MEFSGPDIATIRLLHETYGYTSKAIATSMGCAESVVNMAIEEFHMAADPALVLEDMQKSVQEKELHKQLALMPHYARAEALILGKITSGIQFLSTSELESPTAIATYARALKDLRAVSQTVSWGEQDAGGITVQILNQIS